MNRPPPTASNTELPFSKQLYLLLDGIAWIVVLVACGSLATELAFIQTPNDLDVYLAAARAVVEGSSPYTRGTVIPLSPTQEETFYFLYPPFLATLLYPFTQLPLSSARVLWALLHTAALVWVALCSVRLGLVPSRLAPLAAVVLFFLPMSLDALTLGQVDALVLACIVGFLEGARRSFPVYAASALSLAVMLKATPALLLLSTVRLPERVRLWTWFLVITAVGMTLITVDQGAQSWSEFVEVSGALASGAHSWESSSNRTPAKLVHGLVGGLSPRASIALHQLVVLLVALTVAVRWRRSTSIDPLRTGSVMVVLVTLASPVVWYHHLLWLVIPVTTALLCSRSPLERISALGAALALLATGYVDVFPGANGFVWTAVTVGASGLLFVVVERQPFEISAQNDRTSPDFCPGGKKPGKV